MQAEGWNGKLEIGPEIAGLFPSIRVGFLAADILNPPTQQELWTAILDRSAAIQANENEASIRQFPAIASGKKAYRELGKDPNRYRLSAESLWRRACKGKDLHSISAAVDALNLVSLRTGITIGGFDAGCIEGGVTLGIGRQDEVFSAIGRGDLNIANLPVYRDGSGAIGNPTSDCERTRIRAETTRVLMLITDFYHSYDLERSTDQLARLLEGYCNASGILTGIKDRRT